MKRYHKSDGFPSGVQLPKGRIDFVKVSNHAIKMSKKRSFEIPKSIYLITDDIIEIKVKEDQLFRVLARQKYNNSKDICVVFNTDYKLITAWLIDKNDTHTTLDKSVYEK